MEKIGGRKRIFTLSADDNKSITEVKEKLCLSNDSETVRVIIRKFAKGEVLQ